MLQSGFHSYLLFIVDISFPGYFTDVTHISNDEGLVRMEEMQFHRHPASKLFISPYQLFY